MDVPVEVTQEERHTGFFIHLPSAVHAFIFLARRIQPFLSLVNREEKYQLPGFELTSQRVRRLRNYQLSCRGDRPYLVHEFYRRGVSYKRNDFVVLGCGTYFIEDNTIQSVCEVGATERGCSGSIGSDDTRGYGAGSGDVGKELPRGMIP